MPVTSELAPIRRPHTVHGRSFDADFELTRLAKRGKTRLKASVPRRSSPPVMAVDQPGCDRFQDRAVESAESTRSIDSSCRRTCFSARVRGGVERVPVGRV